MGRKKLTKVQRIANFIERKNPTRKEIIEFLIVTLCKQETKKSFDYKKYRGHYSTSFAKWRRLGNIAIDDKFRYSLTKQGKENPKGLYAYPIIAQLKTETKRRKKAESSYDDIKEPILTRLGDLKRNMYDIIDEIKSLEKSVEYGVVRHTSRG